MDKYTETQATIPTFEQEVRGILEGDYRVQHFEYDGQDKWTLRLARCDRDDAEISAHDLRGPRLLETVSRTFDGDREGAP
jgi:hypothetical protein